MKIPRVGRIYTIMQYILNKLKGIMCVRESCGALVNFIHYIQGIEAFTT